MIERSAAADITDPTLANDPTENADANDPTDPMLSTDPIDPIDRIDPREPMDRMESSDRMDRMHDAMPPSSRRPPSRCDAPGPCVFRAVHILSGRASSTVAAGAIMDGVGGPRQWVRNQAIGLIRGPVDDAIERVRLRGRSAVIRTVRLTGAAALAYAVASATLSDKRPLTAALTALLIVQVTLLGTIADSVRRIIAVVLGVTLAIGLTEIVPFSVWSLSAVIAASILLGLLLRLGPHLLEVPISAMLVLGVGGAEAAATSRISETLVGTAAGLVLTLVLPPAVQNHTAGAAVEAFAAEMAELLERVAVDLSRPVSVEQAQRWLADARRATHHVPAVEQALADAELSRRMNARALGLTETGEGLRTGLDALEHSAVALRALYRSLADGVRDEIEAPDEAGFFDRDVRSVFAVMLVDLAAAIRGFGAFVRGEADDIPLTHPEQLEESIESARELRARLTDLLLVDPRQDRVLWELHGSTLASVERVLIEIDLERRLRERDRRLQTIEDNRTATSAAVARLRIATRQAAERTRPRMHNRGSRFE